MSVGGLTAVPCIALWVGIRPTPLNVQVIELGDQRGRSFQPGGHKVVFHGGVDVNDVPAPTTNVEILNGGVERYGGGSWLDQESMRAVLEHTGKLSSVYIQLEWPANIVSLSKPIFVWVWRNNLVIFGK